MLLLMDIYGWHKRNFLRVWSKVHNMYSFFCVFLVDFWFMQWSDTEDELVQVLLPLRMTWALLRVIVEVIIRLDLGCAWLCWHPWGVGAKLYLYSYSICTLVSWRLCRVVGCLFCFPLWVCVGCGLLQLILCTVNLQKVLIIGQNWETTYVLVDLCQGRIWGTTYVGTLAQALTCIIMMMKLMLLIPSTFALFPMPKLLNAQLVDIPSLFCNMSKTYFMCSSVLEGAYTGHEVIKL